MTATPEAPVEAKPKITATNEVETIKLLATKYPEKVDYKRKIIHLWDSFYRITYIGLENNCVLSAFVHVNGSEIKEYEEKHD